MPSVTAETGFPELPVFSAWIAIPPKGDIEIKVTGGEVITKQGLVPKPVCNQKSRKLQMTITKPFITVLLYILLIVTAIVSPK